MFCKDRRFSSTDPLMASAKATNPQSWNRYSYVGNNPMVFSDPSGMSRGPSQFHGNRAEIDHAREVGQAEVAEQEAYYEDRLAGKYDSIVETVEPIDGALQQHHASNTNTATEPQKTRPDLPDWVRDFYKKRQGTIDRCINRVFGQKADGTADIAATVMPRQTIANAPELNATLMTQFALQAYTETPDTLGMPGLDGKLGHGTVYIASDLYPSLSQEEKQRAFFHELGNIVSGKISKDAKGFPDWYAFGDPKGIGNKYKDKDTGARLEKCIFKTVLY